MGFFGDIIHGAEHIVHDTSDKIHHLIVHPPGGGHIHAPGFILPPPILPPIPGFDPLHDLPFPDPFAPFIPKPKPKPPQPKPHHEPVPQAPQFNMQSMMPLVLLGGLAILLLK